MRMRAAMLVFRKDWREIRRNWQILLPIVAVPILISVVLPTIIIVTPSLSSISGPPLEDSTSMMRNLPSQVREELVGMNAWQAPGLRHVTLFLRAILSNHSSDGFKRDRIRQFRWREGEKDN